MAEKCSDATRRHMLGLIASGATAARASALSVGPGAGFFQSQVTERTRGQAIGAGAWSQRLSVRDFGALGDAVTDDTAAIQAAIDWIEAGIDLTKGSSSPANRPQELYFPPGLYVVSAALHISRSISICGEGHSEFSMGTRIEQRTSGTDIFSVEPVAAGCSVSFSALTLRAKGFGGTGGSLISVGAAPGRCNSIRIVDVTFGTPQSLAINIQAGDDILICRCLFDVSSTNCISLGGKKKDEVVTNTRISLCYFFSISEKCVLLYNVDSILIESNLVYNKKSEGLFVDGYETLPNLVKNITISNNIINNIRCIFSIQNVENLVFYSNCASDLGKDSLSGSLMYLWGTCRHVVVNSNIVSGSANNAAFFDASNAIASDCLVVSNSFATTNKTDDALRARTTTGTIANNVFSGFSKSFVGHRWNTVGNAIVPGAVPGGTSKVVQRAVVGVLPGDGVTIAPAGSSWMTPDGIVVVAYVSAPDVVSVRYSNITGATITIPGHDLVVSVGR